MATPDLWMAKDYVNELAGGCGGIRLVNGPTVAYHLNEQQYTTAVESVNKFWPDNYMAYDKTPMTFTTRMIADIAHNQTVLLVKVEFYLGGAHYGKGRLDSDRKPQYYIQLEDYNAE